MLFQKLRWFAVMPPGWVGTQHGKLGFPSQSVYEDIEGPTKDVIVYDPLGLVTDELEKVDPTDAAPNGIRKSRTATTVRVSPYSGWLFKLKQAVVVNFLKDGAALVDQRNAAVQMARSRLDAAAVRVEELHIQVGDSREPDDIGLISNREVLLVVVVVFVIGEAATIWQGLQYSGLGLASSIIASFIVVLAMSVALTATITAIHSNGWEDTAPSKVAKVVVPALAAIAALVGLQLFRGYGLADKLGKPAETGASLNTEAGAAFLIAVVLTAAATLTLSQALSSDLDANHEQIKAARVQRRRIKKLRQAEHVSAKEKQALHDAEVAYQNAVRGTALVADAAELRLHVLDAEYRGANQTSRGKHHPKDPIPDHLRQPLPKTSVRILRPAPKEATNA